MKDTQGVPLGGQSGFQTPRGLFAGFSVEG